MKGFTRNFKPLNILTEEQVEAIHRGTLNVLEKTGARFEHPRALKLFEQNGCRVDYDAMRVRIPSGLVEECLRKAPSTFHIKARDTENDMQLGGNTLYFGASCGMGIVDLDTQKLRPATRKERDEGCVVMDALDNIRCLGAYTPYFEVEDTPPCMYIPEAFAAVIRYTTKIAISAYQLDSEVFSFAMAKAAGTETIQVCSNSPPMTCSSDTIQAMFRAIEAGFPIQIGGGVTMGSTSPASLAGAVTLLNAQSIATIVLSQLIKPGTRIISSDFALSQNMRTGSPAFGNIGGVLHVAAFNQMWRRYRIPANTPVPGFTSSKIIDFQSSYEKALGAFATAMSGGSKVDFHGGVYGEVSWHPFQAILDRDIAGMVGRFIEGIEVNDETLAIDLINAVGPIPGMYLDKAHTRKWWQKGQFIPMVADSLTYPEWIDKGRKTALVYAKEKMEEILATHKPKPLTPSQDEEIESILGEARAYYKKKGLI